MAAASSREKEGWEEEVKIAEGQAGQIASGAVARQCAEGWGSGPWVWIRGEWDVGTGKTCLREEKREKSAGGPSRQGTGAEGGCIAQVPFFV